MLCWRSRFESRVEVVWDPEWGVLRPLCIVSLLSQLFESVCVKEHVLELGTGVTTNNNPRCSDSSSPPLVLDSRCVLTTVK